MKTALLLVLGVPLLWAAAPNQHLTVETVKTVPLRAGAAAELVLKLKVKEGFHVQANPASKPQLIATKVDVVSSGGLNAEHPVYPKAKPYKVAGLDSVDTYDGTFEVKVPLRATAAAKVGRVPLEGKVRYQACDDKVCFPPTVEKFTATVEVAP